MCCCRNSFDFVPKDMGKNKNKWQREKIKIKTLINIHKSINGLERL